MKNILKLLSLALAVCMALSALVACDSSSNNDETKEKVTNADGEYILDIEQKDYDDYFYLWIMDDTNKPDYHWVKESENDVLSEAIYNRQQSVYNHIGVEIVGTIRSESYMSYTEPFTTAVKAKDGSVDMMLSHNFSGVSSLVSDSYLMDVASLPGVNIDADYWNKEFMDDLSIADKYFLGFSDFNILYTHVITYNKTMMNKYEDAISKNVYDMVRDYEWTLDQMISLANLVYADRTGDGKTADDTFGITGRQMNELPGFFHASNIKIVDKDESGQYVLSLMNELYAEKTVALVEKLKALSESDCSYFDYKTTTENSVPLTSGRTLLHFTPSHHLASYLQYDVPFGVLPYPMWDTAQKNIGYRHLQWGGYITVPAYLDNAEKTGETLELLAYYSAGVKTAYYEKMLGKQVADDTSDREMLTIVWDTVCTEFAQTYCNELGGSGLLYILSDVTYPGTTDNIASTVSSMTRSTNISISKFIKKVENKNK